MPGADYSVACPNYFRTMGIPVLKGREFTQQDTVSAPGVIVINETMARVNWPKESAVGKAIRRAVAHVADADPVIGGHLAQTVHTGTRCAYWPA